MSNTTNIFDRLYTIIEDNFSTKLELKNPYELPDNDDIHLKNGFALSWGTLDTQDTIIKQIINVNRDVTVIFTKKIYTTEQNTSARKAVEKLLMEEELQLIKLFSADSELKKYAEDTRFTSDDGVQFVFDDRQNYVYLAMNFIIDYTEFINN